MNIFVDCVVDVVISPLGATIVSVSLITVPTSWPVAKNIARIKNSKNANILNMKETVPRFFNKVSNRKPILMASKMAKRPKSNTIY